VVSNAWTSLGWEVPRSPELALCHSAAVSAAQTAGLTATTVAGRLGPEPPDVVLLGNLGLAFAVLGRADIAPATGALLVRLNRPPNKNDASVAGIATGSSVRWAGAGRLAEILAGRSERRTLLQTTVRVPLPDVVVNLTAEEAARGKRNAAVIFCIAALRCFHEDSWDRVEETAKVLRTSYAVAAAGHRWGIDLPATFRRSPLRKLGNIASGLRARIPTLY